VAVPSELLSAARTAPFVFFGTVRVPGGSNVELLESDEYPSAVVRVDEVIAAPEAVGDLTGREVTLHLAQAGRLARNSRHMFIATSLEFGNEIALEEIGRVPHRRQVEQQLRRAVLDERLNDLDEAQTERLRLADAVVYGVVQRIESISPESADGAAEPVGEALPGFRAAVLKVWRMLKGRPDEDPRVIFPFPRTQKWSEVPLFVEGMEGVWILQAASGQTLGAGKVIVPALPTAFTALDPLDFHSPGMLARLATLLASTESPPPARRAPRRQ
jgi:hypothetical protein